MNTLLIIAAVFAVLSLPVLYLLEWRFGCRRWINITRTILAVMGFLIPLAVSVLFYVKVSSVPTDIRAWADDFYFGYMKASEPAVLVITALLCVAAAIRHPMIRIRKVLTVLVSAASVMVTFFVGMMAEDGLFAVDVYIKLLGVGMALLPHLVSLCERRKKGE